MLASCVGREENMDKILQKYDVLKMPANYAERVLYLRSKDGESTETYSSSKRRDRERE